MVDTGNGAVAAHGAVPNMQWGSCGHWAGGVGGLGCWNLFRVDLGVFEYTRAVPEYICGCGSWWASAMGQWLHMGPSQTGSVVVVVKQVTTQLQQALQGAARFSMGLPGSCKRMKKFFRFLVSYPDLLVKLGPK